MEDSDWLKQLVARIANLGIRIGPEIWSQPLDWPCFVYIDIRCSFTNASMDKCLLHVESFLAEYNEEAIPRVELVAARLELHELGGYYFGFRLRCVRQDN